MVGRAIGMHWLALVRDVLALGYRAEDILTSLTVADLAAIVMAAPRGSSLREAFEPWSREEQLLANLHEERAGVSELARPYDRPGSQGWGEDPADAVPEAGANERVDPKTFRMFKGKAEQMTWEEAEERDRQRREAAVKLEKSGFKPTDTRTRTL